jgi:hypothetical protein
MSDSDISTIPLLSHVDSSTYLGRGCHTSFLSSEHQSVKVPSTTPWRRFGGSNKLNSQQIVEIVLLFTEEVMLFLMACLKCSKEVYEWR